MASPFHFVREVEFRRISAIGHLSRAPSQDFIYVGIQAESDVLREPLQQNKFNEVEFTTAEHRALQQGRVKGLTMSLMLLQATRASLSC